MSEENKNIEKKENRDKNIISRYYCNSYKSSGVDLDEASKALSLIKKSVTSTFTDAVLNDLSSFSGLFEIDFRKYKRPVLVSSTDGVGTKILVAKKMNFYKHLGQDLVAMCINDILCSGAMPLFFLDYIACGKLEPKKIKIIVESISRACRHCNTVLIGGETAEMPDMYEHDDIDLAGFVVGIVDKDDIVAKSRVKEGDIIVGIPSSGIHSNGFSLVRKIISDKNLNLDNIYDWSNNKTLGDILLTPTRLYYKIINKILIQKKIKVSAIAHITGGGFYENIVRVIPENLDAVIYEKRWDILPIFIFLQRQGNIKREEMYRVFNMGIGMVIIVREDDFKGIKKISKETKEKVFKIGKIEKGIGKVIILKEKQKI